MSQTFIMLALHALSKITKSKAIILPAESSSMHEIIVVGLGKPILLKNPYNPDWMIYLSLYDVICKVFSMRVTAGLRIFAKSYI